MASIIIHTNDKKELSLFQQLALKMGLTSHVLTESENEDFLIAQAIEENSLQDSLTLQDAKAYYQSLPKEK